MGAYGELIPVDVVTGFLGSGKTTLLQRLLRAPGLRDVAVLVNEFGEVGLDHHLIESAEESTLLLDNGCLCCAMRGDLKDSLRELFSRRERGEIPAFARVVIETSGLADPVPIAYTVLVEPVIQHHFRLGAVIAVVDAVNGAEQLRRFPESVKQAATADRIVLSKLDLAEDVSSLRAALRGINAAAPILAIDEADESLLSVADTRRELSELEETSADHSHGISSFSLIVDRPLDWTAFGIWLSMLLACHGERVLRVKGMLNVVGVAEPVLINGVQHIVHPPTHLGGWPDADRRSRIVFITHELSETELRSSLDAFNTLGERILAPAGG